MQVEGVEPRGLEPLTPTLPVLQRFCRAVPARVLWYRDLHRLTPGTVACCWAVLACPDEMDLRGDRARSRAWSSAPRVAVSFDHAMDQTASASLSTRTGAGSSDTCERGLADGPATEP
jgi:hypothetical protein